jgi:hypothetical protein
MQSYNRKTVVTITPQESSIPPLGLAVTLEDIKAYLVIDGNDDDAMLSAFIEAAQDAIKRYTRRGVMTEVVELRMDGFPSYDDDAMLALGPGVHTGHRASILGGGSEFDLPYAPVQSFTSITTFNRQNVGEVLSADAYRVDLYGGRVYLNEGYSWPSNLRDRDAVRARYVIGNERADIPAVFVQAIKQHVAVMYECRDACEMPAGCKALLAGYRRFDDMGFA